MIRALLAALKPAEREQDPFGIEAALAERKRLRQAGWARRRAG